MYAEPSRGLLETHVNQPGMRSGTSAFTAQQSTELLKKGSLKKKKKKEYFFVWRVELVTSTRKLLEHPLRIKQK